MGLRDLMKSHATSVFLNTSHFAETITHRPLGNADNDATVTADVNREPRKRDDGHGEADHDEIELTIATDAVTVSQRDLWVIDSKTYDTHLIHRPDAGLQRLTLRRSVFRRQTTEARTGRSY